MARIRTRLVRAAAAVVLVGLGLIAYDGLTQVASAAPPPVITTDYAAYPPAGSIPAACPVQGGGRGVLQGYRAFLRRGGVVVAGNPAGGTDLRDFETLIKPGDEVVIQWTSWTGGCESLPISFPLKATNGPFFDITDDQALVREPNGPYAFPFCYHPSLGQASPCVVLPNNGGFQLSFVMPQLNVVCGYQLDVVIGGPLETVGPHGSYYQNDIRAEANAHQPPLGTFNPNPPNMLIDAANGAMPCTPTRRLLIDKQWVGTGSTPPVNVPADFVLTVTSSVSQTNLAVIGTATCSLTGGALSCSFVDTNAPGVPQGGLLVNADSLLTVTETPPIPGNTVEPSFPADMAGKYVTCTHPPEVGQGVCSFVVTNTPPPPPPPPPTTAPPDQPTTIPPIDTSIVPPTPETIPATLPATGSSDATPFVLFALVLVPVGVVLVALTRRRAGQN